jgi:hypothetical protein
LSIRLRKRVWWLNTCRSLKQAIRASNLPWLWELLGAGTSRGGGSEKCLNHQGDFVCLLCTRPTNLTRKAGFMLDVGSLLFNLAVADTRVWCKKTDVTACFIISCDCTWNLSKTRTKQKFPLLRQRFAWCKVIAERLWYHKLRIEACIVG